MYTYASVMIHRRELQLHVFIEVVCEEVSPGDDLDDMGVWLAVVPGVCAIANHFCVMGRRGQGFSGMFGFEDWAIECLSTLAWGRKGSS